MSECKHPRPILVHMEPGQFTPDQQPYNDSDEHIALDTIYNYSVWLMGYYCTSCETLLSVEVMNA